MKITARMVLKELDWLTQEAAQACADSLNEQISADVAPLVEAAKECAKQLRGAVEYIEDDFDEEVDALNEVINRVENLARQWESDND